MARQLDADRIADTAIGAGAALAALGPLILLVEFCEWLASGQWPGWSIENGLMFFGVEKPLAFFDATQFMLDLLVSLPLALGLYIAGQLLFSFGINFEKR
jgi:hypothetical protein